MLAFAGAPKDNYGTNRARTCDPLLVRQVLSQLSYDPTSKLLRFTIISLLYFFAK